MTSKTAPHEDGDVPFVYTAQEVSDLLKISRDSVRLATVNGTLPHRSLGGTVRSIRYTREDIDAFLRNQARVGLQAPGRGHHEERVHIMGAPRRRQSG